MDAVEGVEALAESLCLATTKRSHAALRKALAARSASGGILSVAGVT
jgi:hypothetical protein